MKNVSAENKFEIINGKDFFPLSHQQKFILEAETRVKERKGDMNTPFAIRIHDKLDLKIFEKAVRYAIKKYDILRIVLEEHQGEIVQRCVKDVPYENNIIIPEGDTVEERYTNAYNSAYNIVSQSLPLYNTVLWRIYIYKLKDDDFLVVINFHHVIVDGSAGTIFYNYLKNAYEAILEGREVADDNSSGFIEFVISEIGFSKSERGQKQIKYWQDELEGYKHIDLLPYGSDKEENMSAIPFFLNKKKMEAIATRENISHFALTMMAYHIGISKLTGKLDTEIGFSCANRLRKEFFGTMGYLSRAVQNRITISEDVKIKDLLKVTFNKISQNISAQQTSHYNDDSQFYLSYANDMGSVQKMEFNNKPCELIKFNVKHKLDFLTIIAYDENDKVRLIFAGDTKIFGVEFVKKLAMYINKTIEEFYENPELAYKEICII